MFPRPAWRKGVFQSRGGSRKPRPIHSLMMTGLVIAGPSVRLSRPTCVRSIPTATNILPIARWEV